MKKKRKVYRGRNEKKKDLFIFLGVAIVLAFFVILAVALNGCASAGNYDNSDIVSRYSRTAGQLEATVSSLDRTVSDSRERVRKSIEYSKGIADSVERLEYLFDCYEREVSELLSQIDSIRGTLEATSEDNNGSDSSVNNDDNSGGSSAIP